MNLLLTMLIGGIWHGAGWTFVLWGALHGTALAAYHLFRDRLGQVPTVAGWLATQTIVVLGWVLFRAESLGDAGTIYARLATIGPRRMLEPSLALAGALPPLAIGVAVALLVPNTATLEARATPRRAAIAGSIAIAAATFLLLGQRAAPEFLYYDF